MSTLKKPIVTEKATALNEKGQYAFEVERTANKVQIKKEIEALYGVTVTGISTIRTNGKLKSKFTKGGSVSGRRPHGKKAIVTVKEGDVIDFYNGI
ncbi:MULTISPECIES: 50S ribosomal protein L23 [Hymenobacter]|uniref:Large ribosomal subunit protein uL23 n=5 Tax=Hymenobacter TaxID=89966 RepID=A0A4Z0PXD0_9BACT|nr:MULTISPECIES: 50S ribosomal protein L23 [Hymenobacter]PJJ54661.1 large subunit ribosomal protein L23 [Hymenobacter chitinivorans DSM 11115]TGE21906.1 50S ribosomal protein L23 [Hymenobacter aquaticus]TGE27152.1 50S ribosomal protein L23 [Hymenobacter metallicola]UOQ53352.1 50S ribosomal protein L23 [Hymenobacter cellulosivorans]UOQ72506.1 50S ribosomal protein L23 [Hymenobacter cellulosilyticus]